MPRIEIRFMHVQRALYINIERAAGRQAAVRVTWWGRREGGARYERLRETGRYGRRCIHWEIDWRQGTLTGRQFHQLQKVLDNMAHISPR